MDWSKYDDFSKKEFDCQHTGRNQMKESFMDKLQQLRDVYGKPMVITSGYRDPSHPIESRKATPGAHSFGVACDVAVHGENARELVGLAIRLGFTGIGIKQKGDYSKRFIHLDIAPPDKFPRPWLFSY